MSLSTKSSDVPSLKRPTETNQRSDEPAIKKKIVSGVMTSLSSSTQTKQLPPSWFSTESIHFNEVQFLPEFFTGLTTTKTPEFYMNLRNQIFSLYKENTSVFLTATETRKQIIGDVCTIIRIHEFLDSFSIINFAIKPDLRPITRDFVPPTSDIFTEEAKALVESLHNQRSGEDQDFQKIIEQVVIICIYSQISYTTFR